MPMESADPVSEAVYLLPKTAREADCRAFESQEASRGLVAASSVIVVVLSQKGLLGTSTRDDLESPASKVLLLQFARSSPQKTG